MRKLILILILMLYFIASNGNAVSFFQTALATSSYVAMSLYQSLVMAANTTNTTNTTSPNTDSKDSTLSTIFHIAGGLASIAAFVGIFYCCCKKIYPKDKTDTTLPPPLSFDNEACTSRNYRKNNDTDAATKFEEYDIDIVNPKESKKPTEESSDYDLNELIYNATKNPELTIKEIEKDLKGKGKEKRKKLI